MGCLVGSEGKDGRRREKMEGMGRKMQGKRRRRALRSLVDTWSSVSQTKPMTTTTLDPSTTPHQNT